MLPATECRFGFASLLAALRAALTWSRAPHGSLSARSALRFYAQQSQSGTQRLVYLKRQGEVCTFAAFC